MKEPGFTSKATIKEREERIARVGTPATRISAKPLLVFILSLAFLVYLVLAVSGQLEP